MATRGFFYDAQGLDREIDVAEAKQLDLDDKTLLWLDLSSQDSIADIGAILGFDACAIEQRVEGRPCLENHGNHFRFCVNAAPAHRENEANGPAYPHFDDEPPLSGKPCIDFIVSEHWLVTIHDADVTFFERFRDQAKAETVLGLLTGQSLASALLDWHLGEYFDEVSRIEAAVDKLDERVVRESATTTHLGRMVALRRRVSKLRALLVDQRDVFYGLARPDFALATNGDARPFYEALVGRFERAADEIERCRGVVMSSFDLFTSRTSQQTNDLVKVLTFLTAIVGFCAAIAGLMGMNFNVGFFDTGLTGFGIVTGGLLVIALGSVFYARHREWI